MKNSIIHLIRYAKAQGCSVSVFDGEEWAVRRSNNEKEIMAAVNSVDECHLSIRKPHEIGRIGTAYIVNGLEPDELIADHTSNAFFDAWSAQYQADNA